MNHCSGVHRHFQSVHKPDPRVRGDDVMETEFWPTVSALDPRVRGDDENRRDR